MCTLAEEFVIDKIITCLNLLDVNSPEQDVTPKKGCCISWVLVKVRTVRIGVFLDSILD
jgi:hypothetical protein